MELPRADTPAPEFDEVEVDSGAETEIEAQFKRRIAGLRRLPRNQRTAALQAARNWRLLALRAVQERRADDRATRHMLRLWQRPVPR